MVNKRGFDIILATMLIILLFPLFLIAAAGILLSSSGPILYMGIRTGLNGNTFQIFKFRTMVVDAEQKGGSTTALNDPRIFPFGSFLRKYKIDELPQLFNVLRGEMSLVGPRPELPLYTDRYTEKERKILSVRPGITDLSSMRFSSLDEVVGARDADRMFEEQVLPEKNRLRLHYVETQSFALDLKILCMTVWCIVRKLLG